MLAEDAFQQARMARRTKVWDNVTISDVATQLASQVSLQPKITGLTDNIGVQVQLNESDLAFLRRPVTLPPPARRPFARCFPATPEGHGPCTAPVPGS